LPTREVDARVNVEECIWGEAGGRTKRSKQAGGTGEEWPGKGKERRSLIT